MFKNLLLLIIRLAFCLLLVSCSEPLGGPTTPVQISDLTGTWVAHYGEDTTDTIVLKDDGTFRQVYQDVNKNYIFETTWNEWNLDQLPSGVIRIHLHGARYYLEGIIIAEKDGRKDPENPCLTPDDCTWGLEPLLFYDPYAHELVEMLDELLLDVRADKSGNLLLHHLWTSSDRGFAIIGGKQELFFRSTPTSSP
jgi:hypothetical protein